VEVRFQAADGYYLYRDKFKLFADNGAVLGEAQFPAPERKVDPQFGETSIYRHVLVLPVKVASSGGPFTLSVKTQGCADAGLCYPPFTRTASLTLPAGGAEVAAPQDESGRIGALLSGQTSLALVLLSFFGFGLLLSFTPCVFPMIPILSGIIVGHGNTISKSRALVLSLAYVLGMAVTYTLAGIAAGLSGTLLSAALQNAWVLGGCGAVVLDVWVLRAATSRQPAKPLVQRVEQPGRLAGRCRVDGRALGFDRRPLCGGPAGRCAAVHRADP